MNFAALPDDLLLAIAGLVHADARRGLALGPAQSVSRLEDCFYLGMHPRRPGSHPLVALSMTCRRLRALCATIIFRLVVVSDGPSFLEDPSLLRHAQTLLIYTTPPTEDVVRILQNAPHVQELCFQSSAELHPLLFALRTLEVVTLSDVTVPLGDIYRSVIIRHPLRAFRLVFSTRWARFSIPNEAERDAERAFVQTLLLQARESLEQLILPGESTHLAFLAASHWQALEELAICGAYPPDLDDVPVPSVLRMLPNLRVLTLALAPHPDQAPLLVWPEIEDIDDQSESLTLRRLRRFTLSFPQPEDHIFSRLPSSLTELSLRDTPRHYQRHNRLWLREGSAHAVSGLLLSCDGALRIFRALPLPTAAFLLRLELVVREVKDNFEADVELYAYIANACPQLQFFELHRYRDAAPRDPAPVPADDIAQALKAFVSLRELRLNLDFPRIMDSIGIIEDLDATALLLHQTAHLFASALPWLTRIALLSKEDLNIARWRSWVVAHGGDSPGGVLLRELEFERLENMDMYWI